MKAKVNNFTTITTHQNIPQQRLKSILSSRILFSISLLFESVIGNNKLKKKEVVFYDDDFSCKLFGSAGQNPELTI